MNETKSNKKIDQAATEYLKSHLTSVPSTVKDSAAPFNSFLSDQMLIIKSIRKGIPYSFFKEIKNQTPFSESEWAELLHISTKTLKRYKSEKDHQFRPLHSEKIIELAEVTNAGKEVFDSKEQFYSWLTTSSFALGSMKPIELLKDSYGKEMVLEELKRMEHGIFV